MKQPMLILLLFCLAVCATVRGEVPMSTWAVTSALPAWESRILLGVGQEYNLSADQLRLLLTIRRIENGPSGVEMGVAANNPQHRARRYAGDPLQSLRVQARWAAGTIRSHYTGNLETFAQVYCPPGPDHWSRMARYWMSR